MTVLKKEIRQINNLKELKKRISQCRYCEDKFGFEPNPIVFGNGSADIVHISQAPSKKTHKAGKAFSGKSGKRLREWYQVSEDTFYNPDIFYITAIAHCFPGKNENGGDVKPPEECADRWLSKELSLVENQIYIIAGKQAADYLFPEKDYRNLIFNDQSLNGKPAFVVPHPSPANRKWFKDNPRFKDQRLPEIRNNIHEVI